MTFNNNREHVLYLIEQGGATNESIEQTVGITNKSRGTIFAQLRLMGKYPMKDENGVYRIATKEEFDESRAASASKRSEATPLTPEQALDKAKKREAAAAKVLTTASKRLDSDPENHELQLRKRIAELQLELASILLNKAEALPGAGSNEGESASQGFAEPVGDEELV